MTSEWKKIEEASELQEMVEEAQELARELGLDPYPVKYWVVDNDEMNELIAYDGFQNRYPHWRWGMKYDRQQKKDQYLGGKAFEIVNNDKPANAFLQVSNTLADQKAVVTHVEAHSDFFKNNQWFNRFSEEPDAAQMIEQNAKRVEEIMNDSDVDREEVERFIDAVKCIEDTIDQRTPQDPFQKETEQYSQDITEEVDELDIRDEVKERIFSEEWLEEHSLDPEEEPVEDVLAFLIMHGQQYDEENERAEPFEEWQLEILKILRQEAYYFAPQRITKTMNEGWAAMWESIMMGDEGFADIDELIKYANHQSAVLNSPGFNPYKLGKQLWEHIENYTNRREVVDKLLRVEGISSANFQSLDFEKILNLLEEQVDEDIPAERNYSLLRPQNNGYLKRISQTKLEEYERYILEKDQYETIEEAIQHVDLQRGWERLFEVRSSHNDVTFIDEFLDNEFVKENNYFTYEKDDNGQMRVASTDPQDVKKKLLLEFTNLGKPTVVAADDNYNNKGELLLEHQYNGIEVKMNEVRDVLKYIYKHLWGRPVNFHTLVENDGELEGRLIRCESEDETVVEPVDIEKVEHLKPDGVDYDTSPEQWD